MYEKISLLHQIENNIVISEKTLFIFFIFAKPDCGRSNGRKKAVYRSWRFPTKITRQRELRLTGWHKFNRYC